MARFDRYMLSRFMILFGFFALVLVAVYWVNRAVLLFDRLIGDGHSAGIFLEFTALSLPNVIRLVLPMAAFAATTYVTNRLSQDSELAVVQATGFSPWRLARAPLAFGVIVMAMMLVLSHLLVPASLAQLREREGEIAESISAQLLREGQFLHPSRGLTFYIGEITDDGQLRDVFLSDRRQRGRAVTYIADTAYVLREDGATNIVMLNGVAQTLDLQTERLSTTTFADLTYDVSALVGSSGSQRPRTYAMSTADLLLRTDEMAEAADDTPGEVLEEAHNRFQQPLLALVAALVGYSALMVGGFSRFGLGRQIVFAIFLLVVIKLTESVVTAPVRSSAALWPLIYLPTLVGLLIVAALLHVASRPFRRARPRRSEEVAPA
ncbi:lipopolysaccharide export system permease protein [Roseivivax marinus]|uniref:LPS export ABC transporter permease LptF n=1 Tax=Roseivivax marinus TaxID=1379903 RepID=UPI0008C06639|nr:LPS export ABC transporter permease LptF [Roseivivax marinus]SEL35689.1 lipopolysaccharide export system permease protein [Roseivivax marinus]